MKWAEIAYQIRIADAGGAVIRVETSSAHPVEYSILLLVLRDGAWQTVRLYDNSHGPEEHHMHTFTGGIKQAPEIWYGPANAAMGSAIETLRAQWRDIVSAWERTL